MPETAWSWNADQHRVTVTTGPLALNAQHTVTLSGTASANPTSGEVIGAGGLCLGAAGGATASTPVQSAGCDHSTAQQYRLG